MDKIWQKMISVKVKGTAKRTALQKCLFSDLRAAVPFWSSVAFLRNNAGIMHAYLKVFIHLKAHRAAAVTMSGSPSYTVKCQVTKYTPFSCMMALLHLCIAWPENVKDPCWILAPEGRDGACDTKQQFNEINRWNGVRMKIGLWVCWMCNYWLTWSS